MAIRHEFSSVEYQGYRCEVLDSLFYWHDECADYGDKLVVDASDIESLVSDLADSIALNVSWTKTELENEPGVNSTSRVFGHLTRTYRWIKARFLPEWLLPRDQRDWLSIWTVGLVFWHTLLVILTFATKGYR